MNLFSLLLAGMLLGPVGASVGPTAPDGTEPQLDLPAELHLRNKSGRDGSGLCVFTSVEHSAHWQDVPALQGFRDWMTQHPGGGYPAKLADMIARRCREQGTPEPAYVQVEGDDLEVLRLALKTGRMPAVTYGVSPTGRYGGGRIAHMVSLVHGDGERWAVLDNNYPGPDKLEWMSTAEFRRAYTISGGGWCVVLLAAGPPPPPRAPAPAGLGTAWHALARLGTFGEMAGQFPGQSLQSPGQYRWVPTDDPDQVALYHGARQLGVWRVGRQRYYALDAGRWVEGAPPVSPPPRDEDTRRPDPQPSPVGMPTGVESDRLAGGPARYTLCGLEVSRRAVIEALGQPGRVPDDSAHWRLTVIGSQPDRERVLADLATSPHLAPWRDKVLVKAYPPDHWALRPGFATGGQPTIYVQLPGGAVLHRQDDYLGGAESLAEGLRRADPLYRPDGDRDRRRPDPTPPPDVPTLPSPADVPLPLLVAGGALLLLFATGRRQSNG